MGVRGKVEAVLYAAEEPVTLAQLAALFGAEALAERARGGERMVPAPVEEGEADSIEQESAPAAHVLGEDADDEITPRLGDPDADKRAKRLRDRLEREAVRELVAALTDEYDAAERGMEIREIAGGYRVATRPEYHDAVRGFARSLKPPMKLTLQALETLAVIAYKQPVTAPEISEIRGVDSAGVLGSLMGRKLVTTAGRKQVIGRPMLYKTTREFLLRFGLRDLGELPSMEEFEKMAGELQESNEEAESPRPPGSTPRLEPLAIEVSEEEPVVEGVSVNKSGVPVPDVPAGEAS